MGPEHRAAPLPAAGARRRVAQAVTAGSATRARVAAAGMIVALAAFAPGLRAQSGAADPEFALRFDYFSSSRNLDDADHLFGVTAQAAFAPAFGERTRGRLELRMTNPDVDTHRDADLLVREAYLAWAFAAADLRIGRQIVAWGRADGVNPTDNLTPRDYTALLPFEDEQRRGTGALVLDGYFSDNLTGSLFVSPLFEPNDVPLPDTARFGEDVPGPGWSATEFAVKLNRAGGRVDWSLSYFHGYNPMPTFAFDRFDGPLPVFVLQYDRVRVWGADMAFNVGAYGFRGEIAYSDPRRGDGPVPFELRRNLYYVIGGDRTFGGNLSVNLQFFGRNLFGYEDPGAIADPGARAAAEFGAILNGQIERASYGITARVKRSWLHETLDGEVLYIENFSERGRYLRPSLVYAIDDHLGVTFGAELYAGPDRSLFGLLERNRTLFAELRYDF